MKENETQAVINKTFLLSENASGGSIKARKPDRPYANYFRPWEGIHHDDDGHTQTSDVRVGPTPPLHPAGALMSTVRVAVDPVVCRAMNTALLFPRHAFSA